MKLNKTKTIELLREAAAKFDLSDQCRRLHRPAAPLEHIFNDIVARRIVGDDDISLLLSFLAKSVEECDEDEGGDDTSLVESDNGK
jgi:hypothetical protein